MIYSSPHTICFNNLTQFKQLTTMLTFTNLNITEFYSYRRAAVDTSIWINLDLKDKSIIRNYLNNAGHSMDNHICWKDSDGVCYQYSDGQLGIGVKIIEQKW